MAFGVNWGSSGGGADPAAVAANTAAIIANDADIAANVAAILSNDADIAGLSGGGSAAELVAYLSPLNDGIHLVPNTDLSLQLIGGNIIKDDGSGNLVTTAIASVNPMVFDVLLGDGTVVSTAQTQIPVSQYDDGTSTPDTIGASTWASGTEFFIDETGAVKMLMGQVEHSTILGAVDSRTEEKKIIPAALDGFLRIATAVNTRGENNLTTSNSYLFHASKIGEAR